jgi:hypothetical protein
MKCPPINPVELRELWASDMRSDEICERLGVTRGRLFYVAKQLGLPRRPHSLEAPTGQAASIEDPTEFEIAARAAVIRQSWSEEEHEKRFVGPKNGRVTLSHYVFDGSSYSFRS